MPGISIKAATTLGNNLKYNGKEKQREEFCDGSGLEWLYYGARMYDVQIGRWHAIDPLAGDYENQSPYVFVRNNPLIYVDPDGRGDTMVNSKPLIEVKVTTNLNKQNREPYTGFLGTLNYYWTGGIEGNNRYNKNGDWIGNAPYMGIPPDFGLTKFSFKDIRNLFKLFKSTKSSVSLERLHHIFGKPEHALETLINKFGSQEKAFEAVQDAANIALRSGKLSYNSAGILPNGNLGHIIDVGGMRVRLIGGRVEDGKIIIASFSRKGL